MGHLRAGVVALDDIGARLGNVPGELLPVLFIHTHDRNDKAFIRKVFLQFTKKLQVLLVGVIGYLLHILETDKREGFLANVIETRGTLIGDVGADRLENNATAAGFEKLGTHLVGSGYRRGREKEGDFHNGIPENR